MTTPMTTEELHEQYQLLCTIEDDLRDELTALRRVVNKTTIDRKDMYRKWKEAKAAEGKTL